MQVNYMEKRYAMHRSIIMCNVMMEFGQLLMKHKRASNDRRQKFIITTYEPSTMIHLYLRQEEMKSQVLLQNL